CSHHASVLLYGNRVLIPLYPLKVHFDLFILDCDPLRFLALVLNAVVLLRLFSKHLSFEAVEHDETLHLGEQQAHRSQHPQLATAARFRQTAFLVGEQVDADHARTSRSLRRAKPRATASCKPRRSTRERSMSRESTLIFSVGSQVSTGTRLRDSMARAKACNPAEPPVT